MPRNDWKNSNAKKLLYDDLMSGKIPLTSSEMPPAEVYLQREEFSEFEYGRFRDRLRDLRRQIAQQNACAASESASLAHDRQIHPKKPFNYRGEPRWEGSDAERLLRLDMDQGKHKKAKPLELYTSRKEYFESYPLRVFRGHIDQEERRRKFVAYLQQK